MGNKKLVSIIMACYNGSESISNAIASIFLQTYDNWELIFVDDGSIDNSIDIVRKIDDKRIKIHQLDKNYGRGYAYQIGNNNANGEYIAILDVDDWWYSTKLEKQVHYLEKNKNISVLGTGMIVFDSDFMPHGIRNCYEITNNSKVELKAPPLAFATICMRRYIINKYEYDKRLSIAQDMDFLQRICLNETFANLPEHLYAYFENKKYNWDKIKQAFLSRIFALKKFRNEYPFKSRIEVFKCYFKLMIYWIFDKLLISNILVLIRNSNIDDKMKLLFLQERDHIKNYKKNFPVENKSIFNNNL